MAHTSSLVRASALQLAAGLAGQLVALRRQRAFDIPFLQGDADHVARDSWWIGTALSAPSYMLAAQTWAVIRLAGGPDDRARRVLRLLAAGMVPGVLLERRTRGLLRPRGFDPVETPIVIAVLAGAVAMLVLGRPQPRP
ncbi:hypothetical protein FHU33_0327 [Blastococcus colisei]|uniref:Uncharacterized protein n=1 Tax=Blastococcus colisei TaxID=1564162 RepID=A0A543PA67_9ACTN|nr:hypothetical protein [Blastococcus colisei]TQN40975.1 hypothetical protein FHU33_0327 [Blastococcus colisei]